MPINNRDIVGGEKIPSSQAGGDPAKSVFGFMDSSDLGDEMRARDHLT